MVDRLRGIHHWLAAPLARIGSAAADVARRRRAEIGSAVSNRPWLAWLRDRRAARDQLYAWWWWRSPNRPHISDRTYLDLLNAIPEGSVGLDLGSRSRVREDAISFDVEPADGVDVVGDGHELPFVDDTFDYVWCNAVLEHVRKPWIVANEVVRVLKPGGVAVIQVPFLENVHGWPDDYYRFTPNGLRTLFEDLDEVAVGVSAGPGQVLPDFLVYYGSTFSDIQGGGLLRNLGAVVLGTLVLPVRYLDRAMRKRPSWWKWARAFYFVGRKSMPPERGTAPERPRAIFVTPSPSGGGFDEIMRLRTQEMVRTLKTLGVEVGVADAQGRGDWLDAFDPDFYLAPNLNYLLMASLDERSVYRRHPRRAALLWDDPLGALALWHAQERGGSMGSLNRRESGVLERFRGLLAIEGARHFAWDSGHIEAATGLELVDPSHVEWYEIATYAPFLDQGRAPVEPHIDVSFSGNIYEAALAKTNFQTDQFYVELTDRITSTKLRDLGRPVWEIMRAELAGLPENERAERGLHPDESPFWDYYLHTVWLASTTTVRTSLMAQIARPVQLFGVFADPESVQLLERHPNLVYAGHVHHYRELPRVFASTKVNVCISNGLIYRGVPSKLIDCLASGGFALVDPKDDLERLFGPEVRAIVFHDADELNAKIEYYLSRPDERREIVATLRERIEERCTLDRLLSRVLAAVGPGRAAP